MRQIDFYKTVTGVSPVEEFLDTLSDAQTKKILWAIALQYISALWAENLTEPTLLPNFLLM